MKYFVANWKANKNLEQALLWVDQFNDLIKKDHKIVNGLKQNKLKIIICPSFHLLSEVKNKLLKLPNIALGSQDVSFYNAGSYTGEVAAVNLKDLVEYSIIGHSERRKYFHETNATVDQKVALAKQNDIEPIVCVRGTEDLVPDGVTVVAYEPAWAIGTGETEKLSDVLAVKKKMQLNSKTVFIYGAGVTVENSKEFITSSEINGLLMGTISLDPSSFYEAILGGL